ncbi:MAG: ATP-binding protein [Anaerolineaceae bacterium]
MYRFAMENLLQWKLSANRKPLIIRGARQVGKTWLMKEFGRENYDSVAYINFENNERMRSLFEHDLNVERLMTGLQIETNLRISADTLIIFDEIQEAPNALTSLKYFQENAPEYHILAAGSALGVALHEGTSFPVGKVEFLDLHPLSFTEFLLASGNKALVDLLNAHDINLITSFKTKYIDLLKIYYFVGGMPEAVLAYIDTKSFSQIRDIQKRLLLAYEQDFSKHASYEVVPRIRLVWNSIPAQLSKENRKFIYGVVKQGARAREYELALQGLEDSGLIHKVYRVTKPEVPLSAYQDFNAFKLFMFDVGLLGALSNLDALNLLEGNRVFTQFKGALTEQYVFQQLFSTDAMALYYWSADKSSAEIDFIAQLNGAIYPIEVKAAENLQAKSLKSYRQQFNPKKSIRTSMADFHDEGWLLNLPLYMINQLRSLVSAD